MTNNQDARPFVDLNKDAKEFEMKFEEDIKECLCFLDAKITSLICDPDTLGTKGKSIHQNALAEFSKAKYDIFISVKSLINAKEREWLAYIAEMKKLFIENVEIFLAGTKLEVKLPSSESASSYGPRKSPSSRKSTSGSVTSSIYPILNTIIKNIPGSSIQDKDAPITGFKTTAGDKTQFNRRGRLSTSSIKLAGSHYEEEEMDAEETALDRSQSHSSYITGSRKLSNSGLNTSQLNLGRRSSLKKETDLGLNDKNVSILEKQISIDVSRSVNGNELPIKVRGRRGKVTEKNLDTFNIVAQNSSTDENEGQTIERNENEIPVKGRRGRSAPKAKPNDFTVVGQNSSTDENEAQTIEERNENEIPLKGRRGRSAPKAKPNDFSAVAQNRSSSTDEDEVHRIEMNGNEKPLKGRRGRSAPKAKSDDFIVVNQNIGENESQTTETRESEKLVKGRKGRSASKTNNVADQNVTQKPGGRGRRGAKAVIEEEIYEPGPSKFPRKVPFSGDHSSSEELDIQTPLARPAKSTARRKTLLPNLEDASGADIIPGNPSRSKSKRKTISGASELQTVAPSKRLKMSQKSVSSQEEDNSGNDNLLESDGNYSDWMALKSIDGKIPTQPAVYELKVWRAKKPAFIGSCESLRQKLTLYNLRQNSGHKHLDKFIDRNYNDIQVRYEVLPSFNHAKGEANNRIKSFAAQHKTNPAYN